MRRGSIEIKRLCYSWLRQLVALLLLAPVVTTAAQAGTITATCYSPSGERIIFTDGKLKTVKDGYSNLNPTFFFTSNNPDVLIESWQGNVTKAKIIYKTPNVIHAISSSVNEAHTTTLYISRGIGIFTSAQLTAGKIPLWAPSGAVYAAKCTFNRTRKD